MSVGDILFMVLVVAVAVLMTILKNRVPSWLGFVLMLAASIAAIVGGAATKHYKPVPLGVAGVLGTVLVWITGATSQPATDSDSNTLGGIATGVKWWVWLITAVLVVGGAAIGFALPG